MVETREVKTSSEKGTTGGDEKKEESCIVFGCDSCDYTESTYTDDPKRISDAKYRLKTKKTYTKKHVDIDPKCICGTNGHIHILDVLESKKKKEEKKITLEPVDEISIDKNPMIDSISELIGYEQQYEQLKEFVNLAITYEENRVVFMPERIKPPKGIGVFGPAGTGKVIACKKLINEVIVPDKRLDYEIIDKNFSNDMGTTVKIIKGIFGNARYKAEKTKRHIFLFFDEADDMFPSKDSTHSANDKKMINALRSEIDGFYSDSPSNYRVHIVPISNEPENFDPKLKRSGRIDSEVNFSFPDIGLLKKMTNQLWKFPISNDFDINRILDYAAQKNMVGADIVTIGGQFRISCVSHHTVVDTKMVIDKIDEIYRKIQTVKLDSKGKSGYGKKYGDDSSLEIHPSVLDIILDFGKYKNSTVEEVKNIDPGYILLIQEKFKNPIGTIIRKAMDGKEITKEEIKKYGLELKDESPNKDEQRRSEPFLSKPIPIIDRKVERKEESQKKEKVCHICENPVTDDFTFAGLSVHKECVEKKEVEMTAEELGEALFVHRAKNN